MITSNFEEKGAYSLQNKYEIGLLILFILSLIFIREYAIAVMLFICIPGILILEKVFKGVDV